MIGEHDPYSAALAQAGIGCALYGTQRGWISGAQQQHAYNQQVLAAQSNYIGQMQQSRLAYYKEKSRSEKIIDMEYDLSRYLHRNDTITFD